MLNATSSVLSASKDHYFDRNLPWLMPAFMTLMFVITPALADMLGIKLPLPNWLPFAGAIVGSFLTGLRSMFVDTVSARIVRLVGTGLGVGILLVAILRWSSAA